MDSAVKFILSIGGAFLAILYPSRIIFGVLIAVNMVDYVTGILKAISKAETISPDMAFRGIVTKLNRLFYVIAALSADILISQHFHMQATVAPCSAGVITWLVINELISIISNISNNDKASVPPMLSKLLDFFKENLDKE